MTDVLLVFPPQWSPFQPALSLPSLSAWLKRAGFCVRSIDLNVAFYNWLLSDECAQILIRQVDELDWSEPIKLAYRTTFLNANQFRQDVHNLKNIRPGNDSIDPGECVKHHYLAIKSFETYLSAVSQVSEDFTISPYEFQLKAGNLQAPELERMVDSPPEILERFFRGTISDQILTEKPKIVGISCIGQDQLYSTLLLGAFLKEQLDAPVVVGGTIFSRIFERGVLKPQWFHRFFDIIVRNEGEKPCERLLSNLVAARPLTEKVPGIVYCQGERIVSSVPCPPLTPAEIPFPDFDDLPLEHYLSAEITLPLLSSRGCYWGKCEFCHHGMVYGDKYGPYETHRVLESVDFLAKRYGVRHFAFNDEAIPPKVVRYMGQMFPPHIETGWNFTGLIKFERYFKREDFANLNRIGFRSLYIGLESASERVLNLMKKNNKRETIVRNLADATSEGIWTHCFLFFGFPGETDADAQETYDFVLSNPDIIGSFGAGTFVLEHNAPIFHHLEDFNLRLRPGRENDVEVFYGYEISTEVTPERALDWMHKLDESALSIPKYQAVAWVPREHLLSMLSVMTPAKLVELALAIRGFGGLPQEARLPEILSWGCYPTEEDSWMAVNRISGRALAIKGNSAALMRLFYENAYDLRCISTYSKFIFDRLAFSSQTPTSQMMLASV